MKCRHKLGSLIDYGGGYPTVANYSALPAAASVPNEIYVVLNAEGIFLLTRKRAGLWYSDGATWKRLGDALQLFNDANFTIFNDADNTKEIQFDASGISTGTTRTITIPDANVDLGLVGIDQKTKASSNDTTSGYLEDKIVVNDGANAANILEKTTLNDGGDEDVQIQIDETKINHDNLLNSHNLTTDIDHDTITNNHNLTTDIDHDTITNNHNLTTDIDHDQLTNFETDEHFTEASIQHTNIIAGDGSDHSDVASNTTHSTGDGSDHADVASNTTHRTSDGTDHTYINQDVTTTGTPTFAQLTVDNIGINGNTITGTGGITTSGEVTSNDTIGFPAQSSTGDGTTTIDWQLGNKYNFTFGAQSDTFTFTAPTNSCNLILKLKQDGVGGRDATWPATVTWLGDEPTWTDGGANKTIIVAFYYDGTTYWGQGTPWEV